MVQTGLVITSTSLLFIVNSRQNIKCEGPKRSFYNEETQVAAAVGTPTEPQVPKLVQEEQTAESFLESKLKVAREELLKYFDLSKQVYIDKSKEYFDTERKVMSTISSLHNKREELFPNALYVLTGGLFGSVLARKRNIFVKLISPLACGLISFRIFFPHTFDNTFGYLNEAEKESLPDVYTKQTELINKAEDLVKKTSESSEAGVKEISSFFGRAKSTIAEYTGLNVDQIISEKKK